MATLYVVSTPIGNLADLTERGAETLRTVDRVLAEDTRRTSVLLRHIESDAPLVSLHEHNESRRTGVVLEWLDRGETLALVSDAGTPLVSDPGSRLVAAVWEAGHRVVPVPGPSAPIAALVASGLPSERFVFLGFVPRRGRERRDLLERVGTSRETSILFESPERLVALLEALIDVCGGDRRVAIGRELTKLHEEFFRGTLTEALRYYAEGARGEVTVVVAPAAIGEEPVDEDAGRALAVVLKEQGLSPSRVAREVSERLGIPRNRAYELVHSEADEEA